MCDANARNWHNITVLFIALQCKLRHGTIMQQMGERSLERDRAAFASALKKKTDEEAKNNELTWYEKESFGFAISLTANCCCELSQALLKKSKF